MNMEDEPIAVELSESILETTKKLIGIDESDRSFDLDIMMNINAAIFTLNQLGVNTNGYIVTSREDTYDDLLGDIPIDVLNQIKMYFVYKVRLSFDPPTSSMAMECLKEIIKETEWRLNVAMDPPLVEDG